MNRQHPNKIAYLTQNPKNRKDEKKKTIDQKVIRRRFLWLGFMASFILWAFIELGMQQFRVWDKQQLLAEKKIEIQLAEKQNKELKGLINKLNTEDFMLELAHKMGYAKPGEQTYRIPDNPATERQ